MFRSVSPPQKYRDITSRCFSVNIPIARPIIASVSLRSSASISLSFTAYRSPQQGQKNKKGEGGHLPYCRRTVHPADGTGAADGDGGDTPKPAAVRNFCIKQNTVQPLFSGLHHILHNYFAMGLRRMKKKIFMEKTAGRT